MAVYLSKMAATMVGSRGEDNSRPMILYTAIKNMLRPLPWEYDNSRRMFPIGAM